MRVNGIIAEYNPFHNGHKYHLEASKLRTGADYTIIAMSGNFMQRGTPAMIHKYARAEMALRNGADLVLEIPALYACSSAEYYAKGAVSMLDKLGVTDYLCFGSEAGSEAILRQIAEILIQEPADLGIKLTAKLKQGCSYPTARSLALLEYYPSLHEAADVFTSPNNILGIEYIKALLLRQSNIEAVTIKRVGAQYHEKKLGESYPSATAIRHALFSSCDNAALCEQMPDSAHHILQEAFQTMQPIQTDDFSQVLLYKLLTQEPYGYDNYLDISPDLSDKIRKNLFQFRTFETYCELLKSKDNTHTRLSRCLLHILLDIKKQDMERCQTLDHVPYARVLGLRKDATPLLSAIKVHSSIPLITKLADAHTLLSPDALELLHRDIQVSHIYNMLEATKCNTPIRNEYRTPIVII